MSNLAKDFIHATKTKAFDLDHRRIMNHTVDRYTTALARGISKFANLENSKKKAHTIKWRSIENIDKLLLEFELNFQRKGGKVVWANDVEEAQQAILNILNKAGAKKVIKSKSLATEEIHLNEFLKKNNIETLENDLGKYIDQLLTQEPSTIDNSEVELSKEDIAKLFNKKFGTPLDSTPEQLSLKARAVLRESYTTHDVGITGGNFLIADSGSIALTENEGNTRLTTTFPKIHIAVVGIEKIIPTMNDLDLFWPLLSSHSTGQNLCTYNTILGGPRQAGESDGPEQMYLILLDNGRTQLLAQKEQRQALYCIQCSACLNVCPVYKNIGEETYNTTYSGPIGSIITPHMAGVQEYKHLSYASTLCGQCTEVCPVKIEIHKMLLLNRRDSVNQGLSTKSEKLGWKAWKIGMMKRKTMNMLGEKLKNLILKIYLKKSWGVHRELPKVAEKSFSERWRERQITGQHIN